MFLSMNLIYGSQGGLHTIFRYTPDSQNVFCRVYPYRAKSSGHYRSSRRMSLISIPPSGLIFSAGILSVILGIAYLARSGAVKKDFRIILKGLQKVLSMALAGQGLTMIFVGLVVMVLAVSGGREHIAKTVSFMCAGMLFVMGIVTGATGGQSEYVLFRIGQFVQVVAALLILAGNIPK